MENALSHRYLVTSDLSDRSLLAFKRALYFSKLNDGAVDILHVAEGDQPDKVPEVILENAKHEISKVVTEFDSNNYVDNIIIRAGEPHILINQCAAALESKLIVMGAHKKNLVLDMFRGTTAERLMRDARIPVLVRNQRMSGDYASAVFCVVEGDASQIMINAAMDLNILHDADINVIHACEFVASRDQPAIVDDSKSDEKQKSNMVADRATKIYGMINETRLNRVDLKILVEAATPINLIQRAVSEFQADILIVGTKSTVGLERFFLGSVAKEVLRQIDCDILIVPSRREGAGGGEWKT
jgi:universal stress protein E